MWDCNVRAVSSASITALVFSSSGFTYVGHEKSATVGLESSLPLPKVGAIRLDSGSAMGVPVHATFLTGVICSS